LITLGIARERLSTMVEVVANNLRGTIIRSQHMYVSFIGRVSWQMASKIMADSSRNARRSGTFLYLELLVHLYAPFLVVVLLLALIGLNAPDLVEALAFIFGDLGIGAAFFLIDFPSSLVNVDLRFVPYLFEGAD
jgi:hypothetical protein